MGLNKAELKRMITSSSMETLDSLVGLVNKHQEEAQLANTLIVIRGDLVDIERMYQVQVSDYDEYRRGLNKINLNLLKIIDDLPNQYFEESSESELRVDKTSVITDQLRLQVSTLIRDILDINIQENQIGNAYIASILNHKRHIILSQIVRLIESNNISVAGAEYMAIALAYSSVLDMLKAEQYFKRGIENIDEYTDSAFSKLYIIRSYADFLYRNNRYSDGAKQYESAILQVQGDTDNIMNGYTYQMKFVNECDIQAYEEALKSYQKSKDYYSNVENKAAKKYNMEQLEDAWNTKQVPPFYSRP